MSEPTIAVTSTQCSRLRPLATRRSLPSLPNRSTTTLWRPPCKSTIRSRLGVHRRKALPFQGAIVGACLYGMPSNFIKHTFLLMKLFDQSSLCRQAPC